MSLRKTLIIIILFCFTRSWAPHVQWYVVLWDFLCSSLLKGMAVLGLKQASACSQKDAIHKAQTVEWEHVGELEERICYKAKAFPVLYCTVSLRRNVVYWVTVITDQVPGETTMWFAATSFPIFLSVSMLTWWMTILVQEGWFLFILFIYLFWIKQIKSWENNNKDIAVAYWSHIQPLCLKFFPVIGARAWEKMLGA